MRNHISILIFFLSIPAIVLYGFYIVLQTYGLFIPNALFADGRISIIHHPVSSIFKIFTNFCGIATWILIVPMAKGWCNNTIVSRKILTMFTAAMFIGLSPFYPMTYSRLGDGAIIALPAIIFGIYLIIWHCKTPSTVKNSLT